MTDQDHAQAAFIESLAKILADLNEVSKKDPETVMLIGSLADRLCKDSGKNSWPEVKAGLSDEEHGSLVGTFVRQIEDSEKEGKTKIAYALQALATSLVGGHFNDQSVTSGVQLLDDFIASARAFFVRNAPKTN